MQRTRQIEGRLLLVVTDTTGAEVARRRTHNVVVRSGAELLAALFSGSVVTPVNGVAVGISPTPANPPYEASALTTTTPDGTPVLQLGATALVPADISAEVLANDLKVRVSLRTVIGPNRAVSPDPQVRSVQIGEAALGVLAADGNSLATIYNRVVFEPVPKSRDQEMAFYWEIDFPYGA